MLKLSQYFFWWSLYRALFTVMCLLFSSVWVGWIQVRQNLDLHKLWQFTQKGRTSLNRTHFTHIWSAAFKREAKIEKRNWNWNNENESSTTLSQRPKMLLLRSRVCLSLLLSFALNWMSFAFCNVVHSFSVTYISLSTLSANNIVEK